MKGKAKGKVALKAGAMLCVLALSFVSRPARADCETAAATPAPLAQIITSDIEYLNKFIRQEGNEDMTGPGPTPAGFEDNIIRAMYGMKPSSNGIFQYYRKYFDNIFEAFQSFVHDDLLKQGLEKIVRQTHVSVVDQSRSLGVLTDAQLWTEMQALYGKHYNEAVRRYNPSHSSCEMDSLGPGLAQAYKISRALNRSFAYDNQPRLMNSIKDYSLATDGSMPAISATGRAAELSSTWEEYVRDYCDNTMGDQGCAAPGPLAGRHKDLGALLWGNQQTIDPMNPQNMQVINSALRYIVNPLSSDPVPPTAVDSPSGHEAILTRHSQLGFINTIYNVLGAMVSERIGTSGIDVQQIEAYAGLAPEDTETQISAGASYRELMETMTRHRFNNPQYLVRMFGDTPQVTREQLTLGAIRLQTMNDIYRRREERLFMESAEYARDLNQQIPQAAAPQIPLYK